MEVLVLHLVVEVYLQLGGPGVSAAEQLKGCQTLH